MIHGIDATEKPHGSVSATLYDCICSVYSGVKITVLYEGVKQVFIGKLYCLSRIYSSKKWLGP